MLRPTAFSTGDYAVGVDPAIPGWCDKSVVVVVKIGQPGKPDELVASLTWEEAKLVARAVAESETPL